MEYIKLQIGCLAVLLYIAIVYGKECFDYGRHLKDSLFDELLSIGIFSVFFDGLTSYMVNNLTKFSATSRDVCHVFFYISLTGLVYFLMLYVIDICKTEQNRRSHRWKWYTFIPLACAVVVIIVNASQITYVHGIRNNYTIGTAVNTCYLLIAGCILVTFVFYLGCRKFVEKRKRLAIVTYLLVMAIFGFVQMLNPEWTISSIGTTLLVLAIYMNMENPAFDQISRYHTEMVTGFADLVENKDSNTGGHIRRTQMYVEMIANELSVHASFRAVLTNDYISNLRNAAPMHDIGKIAIPDNILQKPGKLTAEEFDVMKQHTVTGGNIIQNDFQNIGNETFLDMAYKVARFHHEKWNGRGYPDGLKERDIPLCARIMAVADVFDAVSAKRCYRDAMPLNKCFDIIREGRGTDFDPMVVDAFFRIREDIERAYAESQNKV